MVRRDSPPLHPSGAPVRTRGLRALSAVLLGVLSVTYGGACGGTAPGSDPSAGSDLPPGAGYNLIAPMKSSSTYLVDFEGKVVHEWPSKFMPGNSVYLLEDGSLLRSCREPQSRTFKRGGRGGRLQRIAWDGELLWEFVLGNDRIMPHHDVEPLENGNVLVIAWELVTREQAVAAGRNPEIVPAEGFWPMTVLEVRPLLPDGGEIVWRWRVWDHLVQDLDPERENYGDVARRPGRVDVNGDLRRLAARSADEEEPDDSELLQAIGYFEEGEEEPEPAIGVADESGKAGDGPRDWLHTNGIDYHPELDQILLSIRSFDEIWILDHGLTTQEAATEKGDLLYRWGNPSRYRRGQRSDRHLKQQHDAQWIEPGLPGAGNILLFDNGRTRPTLYSRVLELVPPLTADGTYALVDGDPYGPAEPAWVYAAPEPTDFYSAVVSGAQRLPNGNTLVCAGSEAWLFEVTPSLELVWEYQSPFAKPTSGADAAGNKAANAQAHDAGTPRGGLFRATRIAADDPRLARLRR